MSRVFFEWPDKPCAKRASRLTPSYRAPSALRRGRSHALRSISALRRSDRPADGLRLGIGTGNKAASQGFEGGREGPQLATCILLEGRCEEALAFYSATLQAEVVTMLRYKDVERAEVRAAMPVGCEHKVLHAELRIGDAVLMMSDGACSGRASFHGFVLTLSLATLNAARHLVTALAVGGTIHLPLGEEAVSGEVGILTDRFGVRWLIGSSD